MGEPETTPTDEARQQRRKGIGCALLFLGGSAVLFVLLTFIPVTIFLLPGFWNVHVRDELISKQVDHEIIRRVGREMLRTLPPVADNRVVFVDDEQIPDAIAVLRPSSVSMGPDFIDIEMGGGFHHYGLTILAEGAEPHGDRQIIDGVWYYSDE